MTIPSKWVAIISFALVSVFLALQGKAQEPIAKYTFDAHKDNKGSGKGVCHLNNYVPFEENAIYVNGVYEMSGSWDDPNFRGFQVFCGAPEVGFDKFSVVVRFKADEFSDSKNFVVGGGQRWRWFGLTRSENGRLVLNLNDGKFKEEFGDTEIQAGRWTTIACTVDIGSRRAKAFVDGKASNELELPQGLATVHPGPKFVVQDPPFYGDKTFVFANYSTGSVFQGLVDGILVYDRILATEEMAKMTAIRNK